jgi:hypothetical protein
MYVCQHVRTHGCTFSNVLTCDSCTGGLRVWTFASCTLKNKNKSKNEKLNDVKRNKILKNDEKGTQK